MSYSHDHMYTHMLTHSYTLNVVYSHDDTLIILYRNSRFLSDKLNLAITQTFDEVLLYIHRNRRFIMTGAQDGHLDFHTAPASVHTQTFIPHTPIYTLIHIQFLMTYLI